MKITELQQIDINKYNTDKFGENDNFVPHNYGDFYDGVLFPIKDMKLVVGEIGIYSGGSVRLFHDYFVNSDIIGFDIKDIWYDYSNSDYPRLKKVFFNAYDINNWGDYIEKFDILIEDGSHTYDDQLFTMNNLYKMVKKNSGLLIIEDIPYYNLTKLLEETTIAKENIMVYNWYDTTTKFDDIIIVIKNV